MEQLPNETKPLSLSLSPAVRRPRKDRTKQWVLQALVDLLKHKRYEEITAQDLANRSGIARQTYYRHFRDKREILEYFVDDMYDDFLFDQSAPIDPHEVFRVIFEVFYARREILIGLKDGDLLGVIQSKLMEYCNQFLEMVSHEQTSVAAETTLWYQVGGTVTVSVQWIKNNMKQSPAELAHLVGTFFGPFEKSDLCLPTVLAATREAQIRRAT